MYKRQVLTTPANKPRAKRIKIEFGSNSICLKVRQIFFDLAAYLNIFLCAKSCIFATALGEMAEWSNAAVLKTVEGHTSGGSNPSSSAKNNSLIH